MSRSRLPLFDADLHHHYRDWSDLEPYLPEGITVSRFRERGRQRVKNAYPKVTGVFREDAVPPGGGTPASDPEFVVEHHLERYGIDYAILSCGSTLGLGDMPDVDLAAGIARATNDWTIAEWLPVDDRFLAAIVISPNDPDQAADEIRRLSSNPRMVVVTSTQPPCLLGNDFMHPIYEACQAADLPFNLHPGGENVATGRSIGDPTSYCEYRATMSFVGIQHLVSLVTEGTFVKYPGFRFVLNEWGIAWLPFLMWRLDAEYRSQREDVPWLDRLPSEYIREFARFTTQPTQEPRNPGDLGTLLSLIDGQDLLMFSSDYPHHDFENPELALRSFPEEWHRRISFDNAHEWYRLGERLALARPEAVQAI